MPDSELRIKTVGGEEAKRTFKSIQDSARQLDKLSVKSSFSPKEIEGARRALSNYFREYKSGLVLLREHEKSIAQIEKRTSDAIKKQREFNKFSKEWFEQERDIRRLGREKMKEEGGMDKLLQSLSRGPGAAKKVQGAISDSGEESRFSGIGKALMGGVGLGTATGIIYKSITAANSINDSLVELSGILNPVTNRVVGGARTTGHDVINNLVGELQKNGSVGAFGTALGFNQNEIGGMAVGMGRTGGYAGGTDELKRMMTYQRKFGVAPESFINLMGASAQGNSQLNGDKMGGIIAEAIASRANRSGFQRTYQEFVDATTELTSTLQKSSGSANPLVAGALLASFSQNRSPFMQGAQGAQMIGQLNQSLTSPGGGIAGQLAMLNVAGFGSPGMSWWGSQKKLSKGFGANPGMLADLLKQSRSYGPEGSEEFLSFVGGLNPAQAEALSGANSRGGLEKSIRKMTSSKQLNSFLEGKGISGVGMPSLEDTIDSIKDKGLGPALASLNARAVMANDFQQLGNSILQMITLIFSDVHSVVTKHPMATAALLGAGGPVGALLGRQVMSKNK